MGKIPRRTKTQPPYKRQISGFGPIAKAAKEVGLEIINLSPQSKIKEFVIASFWDYFPKEETNGTNSDNSVLSCSIDAEEAVGDCKSVS